MSQTSMDLSSSHDTTAAVLLAYGGGVNSVAAAILLHKLGARVGAIVMANPGSEWKATHGYRDNVMNPWLRAAGMPEVTVIDRVTEGRGRARTWRLETLEEECLRIGSLPSIAYGFKKCSQKYKGDTSRWWAAKQQWMRDEWQEKVTEDDALSLAVDIDDVEIDPDLAVALPPPLVRKRKRTIVTGRKILKVFGYDADEPQRARASIQNEWEAPRFAPWYPLLERGLTRDDCEALILDAGLPLPKKSACTFCPSNTIAEWRALAVEEPDAFARAIAMSRNAVLDSPDVVGLLRAAPHGQRQLHEWFDQGMPRIRNERDEPVPCDCAL